MIFLNNYGVCINTIVSCVCGFPENKRYLVNNHQKNCVIFSKISKLESDISGYCLKVSELESLLKKERSEKELLMQQIQGNINTSSNINQIQGYESLDFDKKYMKEEMVHLKSVYYRDVCNLNNSKKNKKEDNDYYLNKMVEISKNNYLQAKENYQKNFKSKKNSDPEIQFNYPTIITTPNEIIENKEIDFISTSMSDQNQELTTIEDKQKRLVSIQIEIEKLEFESYQLLLDIGDL